MKLQALIFLLSILNVSKGFLFKRRERPLAIDGGWSNWQSWSSCYRNSVNKSSFFPTFNGFSVSSRERKCDSPTPVQGGKPCQGSSTRYRQCGCKNPLGMETGKIANYQLSSSSDIYLKYDPTKGRLGNSAAWCSADPVSSFLNIYFKIDFVNFTKVTAIATDGISIGRVSRFKIFHSLNEKEWLLYRDKYRHNSEFIGNVFPGKVKMNELEKPIVTRYLKILPLHSYGKTCMRIEVYGCIFTCGTEMSKSSGEIIGRGEETHDQNCLWKINVKNTTTLSLDFLTFYIPCDTGFIEIRDGSKDYREAKVLKRECGEEISNDLFKAQTNNLWLRFYSNSSSDEVGFRLRYISECLKNIRVVEGEIALITSPNYPQDYFDNNDCIWNVSSNNNLLYLWFKTFDIEASKIGSKERCSNDFVSIEEQQGKHFANMLKYCNSAKPPTDGEPIIIKASGVRLRFKSDNVIVKKGFLLEITSYDKRIGKPTTPTVTSQRATKKIISQKLNMTGSGIKFSSTFSPKMVISQDILNISKSKEDGNSSNTVGHKVKKKSKHETDWTIFTVAAFSCFVFILVVSVTVISIRKCTSRHTGQSGKFLPSISKKMETDESYKPASVIIRSKKSFPVSEEDGKFCELKSPAGSIKAAGSDNGSELGEHEPLKADILNHTLNRERRKSIIDMYTDGSDDAERTPETPGDIVESGTIIDSLETVI